MTSHLAKSEHALRIRTAIGGALTAGALLTAPVVVPAITGVVHAAPAPDPSPALNAIKAAKDTYNARVADAKSQIRAGIAARNPAQVRAGMNDVNAAKRELRVTVQGILRGTLAG
jgi:hypothetical protein